MLWTEIEGHLVEQRRYVEAIREHDLVLEVLRHDLGAFKQVRMEDEVSQPILRITGDSCASDLARHFEALVGSGKADLARSFGSEMIELRPRLSSFLALFEAAHRAGGSAEEAWLRKRAEEVLSPGDHRELLGKIVCAV